MECGINSICFFRQRIFLVIFFRFLSVHLKLFKGSVRPDLPERGISLGRPRKGCGPLQVFLFFYFDLEFFKRVQSSEPSNKKNASPFFLLAGALLFDEKICELFGLFLIVVN
jgi:hypothetical protein